MLRPRCTKIELSEKQQAIHCGGLAIINPLLKVSQLRKYINRSVSVLKTHRPYDEADHILNIALNLLTGGRCLDHLEQRRNDAAYLDALGAERIPDPTTAGDFCRRFNGAQLIEFFEGINHARQHVWKLQEDSFFDQATIEADGTMVETTGEKKQGMGINYKGQWGYHPLVVTLAETKELLYLANRSGNRPSHEDSWFYFDLAIDQCKEAGFRKILLRGDTDFSSTLTRKHLAGFNPQTDTKVAASLRHPNTSTRACSERNAQTDRTLQLVSSACTTALWASKSHSVSNSSCQR